MRIRTRTTAVPAAFLPHERCLGCGAMTRAAYCDRCAPPGPEVTRSRFERQDDYRGPKIHRHIRPKELDEF